MSYFLVTLFLHLLLEHSAEIVLNTIFLYAIKSSTLYLTYPNMLHSGIDKPLIHFITDTNNIVLFAKISDELQLFQTKNLR